MASYSSSAPFDPRVTADGIGSNPPHDSPTKPPVAAHTSSVDTGPRERVYEKRSLLVMGVTGSGKSSFIAAASGQDVVVGHGAETCTHSCTVYPVKEIIHNTEFALIDTPGFDDPDRDDFKILQMIVDCINNKEYPPVVGIIYCHRITDTTMTGNNRLNLEVVKAMCGERFYNHIAVCTTMWNTLPTNSLSKFEQHCTRMDHLLDDPSAFEPLKERGAVHMQFWDDRNSCLGILQLFAAMSPPPRMRVQKQTEQNKSSARKTDAGHVIEEEKKRREWEKREARERLNMQAAGEQNAIRDPRGHGAGQFQGSSSGKSNRDPWPFSKYLPGRS